MTTQKTYSSEKEIAEIWKLFRETREQMKETDRRFKETERLIKEGTQETDRRMQEADRRFKETERLIKEGTKETDRQMKDTDRRLKKLDYMFTGHWGKLMEALTAGGLRSALKERNIQVTGISCNVEKTYQNNRREFDIIATNGEELIAVEVKTTLKLKQVQRFLENIQSFKNYFPEYQDKKVYGAAAYLKSDEGSENYAERKGLFILNPAGNIIKVLNSPNFRPKQMA